MQVAAHDSAQELLSMARLKRFARIRERLRAVSLAMEGRTAPEIAGRVGRSRRTVQTWIRRYNEEGIEGLHDRPLPGQPTKLKREDEVAFIKRIDAGPTEADGVCTLRGEDIRRILKREFGAKYSLNGVYDLLHRLGYSRLRPRPRHRGHDPEAAERWVREAPPFVRDVQKQHPDKRVEVWFQDEARYGQQGTLTDVWAPRGSRPVRIKQCQYKWVYAYGAVNPQTGDSVGMIAPTVNTYCMNVHLRWISEHVGPDVHVVLVMDNAGWHTSNGLEVPQNITILLLPPYSPELNPIERLWAWLKSHQLSNRLYDDQDELHQAGMDAWNTLTTDRIKSVCRTEWVKRCV